MKVIQREKYRLVWLGDEVDLMVVEATKRGIDKITDRCVEDAKSNHPWVSETGTLEASLQKKPAAVSATKIAGRWGSYGGRKVRYAFYVEMGTSKMPAFPYLRPAADKNYPDLTDAIRAEIP